MRSWLYLFLLLVTMPELSLAREVVGWVEKARIAPGDLLVKARVDTGAKISALSAGHVRFFEREHASWVRFSTTNYQGRTLWLERKVVRIANIKQDDGGLQERPVIKLGICLAHVYREAEVSLENREHMNYQLLIGRDFLNGDFLVDPQAVFTKRPHCADGTSRVSFVLSSAYM